MERYLRIFTLTILCTLTTTTWGALKTSTLTFTKDNAPTSNATKKMVADDGIEWTVQVNAGQYSYYDDLGAYFSDASNLTLTALHIPGKVHKIIVTASGNEVPMTINNIRDSYPLEEGDCLKAYSFDCYKYFPDNDLCIDIGSYHNPSTFSVKSIAIVYDEDSPLPQETQYEEVNNISQLKDNDEIVIAKWTGSTYLAMQNKTTTFDRNNKEVTPQDGLLVGINAFCPALLEKAESSTDGQQWYIRCFDGYISGKFSNTLEAANKQDIGENGKATITIDPSTGDATIGFPAAGKYLFFNSSSLFVCSATPSPLRIFRKVIAAAETIDITFKKKFGGWTSLYYKEKSLVVPDDFTAYGYSVTDGQGATSKSYTPGTVIPAGMAVILRLNDGYDTFESDSKTIAVEVTDAEGEADLENDLLGFDEAHITTDAKGNTDGSKFYRLTLDAASTEGSIGFYWGAADGAPFQVGAHKAYLAIADQQATLPTAMPLRIIPYLLGDANGDGQVNVADVMIVVSYVLGNKPPFIKTVRSDVNIDKNINIADIMGIVRIVIGD